MRVRGNLKPGWIPGFLFFVICALGSFAINRKGGGENVYSQVCHFVSDRIYLGKEELTSWLSSCLQRSQLVQPDSSTDAIINDLNSVFSRLNTSHLIIYKPDESQKVWTGESKETGIDADYVEGELVIFKVHRDSPAERAGLHRGDVIQEINGEEADTHQAQTASGVFTVLRDGQVKTYRLTVEEIKRDEEIQLVPLSKETVVVEVPSFRAEYFEKEKWRKQVVEIKKFPKILIDLRGNLGGNFVAGLRFLSPFMCSPQNIGYLWKPKSKLKTEMSLPDDLEDEHQIDVLDQSFLVRLWTFEDYDCLTSSVAVLVDSGTASTAEMVAQALKDYIGAKIYGATSSGQLLVGIWYPLPELGPGVKISIPEAVFQTRRGHKIEGPGVQVDQILYYHLSELQRGVDSWLKAASSLL